MNVKLNFSVRYAPRPRCALLLSVIRAYNKGYTVRGSARPSPKFFFHFVLEKIRISLTFFC